MEPTELLTPPPGPPPPAEEPPPRRELWPWLLVLGLLVLAGVAAAWYATRDSGASSAPQTSVTTIAAAPKPKPRTTRATTTAPTVAQVSVPDLVGQKRDDALRTLEAAGLQTSVNEVPSDQEKDVVVAQAPAGGTKVDKDTTVSLDVSKGPEQPKPVTATVPNVVGESRHDAEDAIKAAGLHPSTQRVPSEQPKDIIVSQSPAGGTSAQSGAGVLLNISNGPPKEHKTNGRKEDANQGQAASTASVPGVIGETESSAKADLRAAGFTVSSVDQQTNDPSQDGIVFDQSPPGGSDADSGSTVTIYVGRYSTG